MNDLDLVFAGLALVPVDDPRHAVVAAEQLGALAALALADRASSIGEVAEGQGASGG